jgi:hypothetical protein
MDQENPVLGPNPETPDPQAVEDLVGKLNTRVPHPTEVRHKPGPNVGKHEAWKKSVASRRKKNRVAKAARKKNR